VAALLLGAAIACGDSTSPDKRVLPRSLDKVSGDEQSVVRGHTIDLPLTVRVVGSDGKPLAGATVQWSLLSGQARLPAKETATNASGEAQALVSEIATIGQLFVSATVADVAPVVF
jgi:hypothetical protein